MAIAILHEAAQDLLEALQFCQSVIKAQGLFDLSERMAYDKAQAAIDKALGKEQESFYKEWPESTSIHSTGYDKEQNSLTVTFKNGNSYRYDEVPMAEWLNLKKTESIGKYVNKKIKEVYSSTSLDFPKGRGIINPGIVL